MPELSQANLVRHNASQRSSDKPPIKQTMKFFHEENEPWKKFLVTGHSVHQHSAKAKDNSKTGTRMV